MKAEEKEMGYLESIQAELVDHNCTIGTTLLKLRLLAAKLGSPELAEWIKSEAEGYDQNATVPSYRIATISFSGTFHGPFGGGIQNAPIPPVLIRKLAGDEWETYKIRESAAAVENMALQKEGLHLDLSNLMFCLRGKVYPGHEPAQIVGFVSQTSLIEAANAIRTRLLEITIEIANKIPNAEQVELTSIKREPELASQIFHQTIHGSMTNIQSSGVGATIQITRVAGDRNSLKKELMSSGLSQERSTELTELIANQEPGHDWDAGLNEGTRKWLAERITKGVDTGFQGGVGALVQLVQNAAMQYWGLK